MWEKNIQKHVLLNGTSRKPANSNHLGTSNRCLQVGHKGILVPIASMYGIYLPTITHKYQLIVGRYYHIPLMVWGRLSINFSTIKMKKHTFFTFFTPKKRTRWKLLAAPKLWAVADISWWKKKSCSFDGFIRILMEHSQSSCCFSLNCLSKLPRKTQAWCPVYQLPSCVNTRNYIHRLWTLWRCQEAKICSTCVEVDAFVNI